MMNDAATAHEMEYVFRCLKEMAATAAATMDPAHTYTPLAQIALPVDLGCRVIGRWGPARLLNLPH